MRPQEDGVPEPVRSGKYLRYVALGDSQTEGVGDGDDIVGLRGWADRLAEHLAVDNPDLQYANLAVRGRRAGEVRSEQLGPALALRPDVATVVAGVNDLLRLRVETATVVDHLEAMFAALTDSGARVATVTFPDLTRIIPLARPVRSRILDINDRIRAAAARHGVAVAEIARHPSVADRRFWSEDRLHCSPLGHQLIAAAVAHALQVPGSNDSWNESPPPLPIPLSTQWRATAELRWAATFLGPWLGRRLRGQSSGDQRTAKHPQLHRIEGLRN